ncbi:hypothetical protein SRHO_G00210310 [Serrasalmus rhombeus]
MEGHDPRRISGFITGRKSCDTLQSVMSSGDALTPLKTGAVGSAIFSLRDNGTLDYQVQVAGVSSDVVGVTIEMKPRQRSKRSVLYDVTADFVAAPAGGRAGELRGQIRTLLYSGLDSHTHELPFPLAGQFASPPVRTSAGGHAWVSVDERCHLHYEIMVTGLGKSHERLLTGFYGEQAQGVLKDLSVELLRHLDKGTAFIQVSTKMNPRGEIRGRIHVPNSCEFGSRGEVVEEAEFDDLVFVRDPEETEERPPHLLLRGRAPRSRLPLDAPLQLLLQPASARRRRSSATL